ncbi:hypothetical protein LXL04_023329 [Taraxacum kok-saghyz]
MKANKAVGENRRLISPTSCILIIFLNFSTIKKQKATIHTASEIKDEETKLFIDEVDQRPNQEINQFLAHGQQAIHQIRFQEVLMARNRLQEMELKPTADVEQMEIEVIALMSRRCRADGDESQMCRACSESKKRAVVDYVLAPIKERNGHLLCGVTIHLIQTHIHTQRQSYRDIEREREITQQPITGLVSADKFHHEIMPPRAHGAVCTPVAPVHVLTTIAPLHPLRMVLYACQAFSRVGFAWPTAFYRNTIFQFTSDVYVLGKERVKEDERSEKIHKNRKEADKVDTLQTKAARAETVTPPNQDLGGNVWGRVTSYKYHNTLQRYETHLKSVDQRRRIEIWCGKKP